MAPVRWTPGSRFPLHGHPGGEEIYVLEGVFEDELGAYPAGSWLRNPAGSRHTPFSTSGALIWVKTGHLPAAELPGEMAAQGDPSGRVPA